MDSKTFEKRVSFFLLALMVFAGCLGAEAQKMPAEEIIAKHVASIGKNDLLANSKNLMVIGGTEYEIVTSPIKASGRAVLASDGSNLAFFSSFNLNDYKAERIGLFDNKIDIPFIIQGRRSALGSFLTTYEKFLGNRLFGGCIFSSWLFLGPESAWGKLETEGKKKVGGRDAWVVRYIPKNGGLTGGSFIRLYFDAENFHHLRTIYYQKETENGFSNTVSKGNNPTGPWDADMASNGITLTEDFEDIRADIGLVLPHKYSLLLAVNGAGGTSQHKYRLEIEEYRLIKEFPANFFHFESGPPK